MSNDQSRFTKLDLSTLCGQTAHAYDVTTGDILVAYDHMLHAAEYAQGGDSALKALRIMLDGFPQDLQVKRVLAGKAGLWDIDPAA